jgi:DNA-binding NarL/FixJ family response regulator
MRRALESLDELRGGSTTPGAPIGKDPGVSAIEAALGAIGAPALMIDGRGRVICANQAAQALIDRDLRTGRLLESIAQRWDRTPVQGARAWSLAVLRPALDESDKAERVSQACARWRLTARQSQVLALVADGMTNVDVAETLGIRLGTVEFHVSAIFDKVGVSRRAALIATVMGK